MDALPSIPISSPAFAGNEKRYVADCMDTGWISSGGDYVGKFEAAFAAFCGTRHAIACCNGTAALHLALLALGLTADDEVIVPTLTFVATANAVSYCGARPVFVDVDPETWNLDPALVEAKITPKTRAIIAVHLYGHPCNMERLQRLADLHGIFLVEDAAEAHGATYRGKSVGSLADVGAFSFFGNKILSTGEGGMVVTNDDALADRVRLFRGQGMEPTHRYWHQIIGYNYRMMNIPAAIGLAQVERAAWHVARRVELSQWYRDELADMPSVSWQVERDDVTHVRWLFTVVIDETVLLPRDDIMMRLSSAGIETRPIFYPMHVLPPYRQSCKGEHFPTADHLSQRGISLPTWAGLSRKDVERVAGALRHCLNEI